MEAALLAGVGALWFGLGVSEFYERSRRGRNWQTVELHFGRDVTTEAVAAVLDRISGLPRAARVALDVAADHERIRHCLHGDQATLETLRGSLRALIPSVRFQPVKPQLIPETDYRYGRRVLLRGRLRVVRDDGIAEISAGLLAALQPLGRDEQVLLRWLIRPGRPMTVPAGGKGQNIETEERRRVRHKNEGSVLGGRGLIAVRAGHPKRAAHLISRVSSALRSRATAYGYLATSPRWQPQLKRDLRRTSYLLMDRYASRELAGLLAWPIEAPVLSGVTLGTSPQLMPSQVLPSRGRVLGRATWPGAEREVAQPLRGALSHTLIAGPTGVGKSTLVTNLVSADVTGGRGLVLIDGKGDTAEAVLSRIRAERADDVVVLDCASPGPQPGVQLFRGSEPELAADVVLGVLSDLFRDSWGPLSERYLRAGLLAVANDPEGTLADVPYVYSDPIYRRKLVSRIHDPLTRATFAAFEQMSAGERQQQLASSFNKLGALLGRPIIRTVLGQSHPKLDFRRVLGAQQIVIISLSPTRVGAPAARLIGAVTVFALFQAIQARVTLAESSRKPFLVYIDEPKALGDLPMPLDAMLEQARGLGVGVTLAPQSITQLPRAVREAALTNVATRVIFRQHAEDARLLVRDLRGVRPEELGDLGPYEVVARIGLGPGDVAPGVTLRTLPASQPVGSSRQLRELSAERWGLSQREVDEALVARHQAPKSDAPVGRKARSA